MRKNFFNSIKSFFNDTPTEEIVYNEATSTLPIEIK